MPTERIAMRRVREMLRLSRDAGLATREVARRTGVAASTLREMFRRFEKSGLAWPLPLELADAELEARLYGEAGTKQGHRRRSEPGICGDSALNRSPSTALCSAARRPNLELGGLERARRGRFRLGHEGVGGPSGRPMRSARHGRPNAASSGPDPAGRQTAGGASRRSG